jgi:hypothetical protein
VLVLALFAGAQLLGAATAHADGIISWEGHGADQLPCPGGEHWVLAPAFGITSATLSIDGTDAPYPMTQNGNGSWSVDTPDAVAVSAATGAGVTYTGDGDERDSLQLSHCLGGATGPTGSTGSTGSTGPTGSPSPVVHHRNRKLHKGAGSLAYTGGGIARPGAAAVLLLGLGTGLLALARRRRGGVPMGE